jgi:hypothetical protein
MCEHIKCADVLLFNKDPFTPPPDWSKGGRAYTTRYTRRRDRTRHDLWLYLYALSISTAGIIIHAYILDGVRNWRGRRARRGCAAGGGGLRKLACSFQTRVHLLYNAVERPTGEIEQHRHGGEDQRRTRKFAQTATVPQGRGSGEGGGLELVALSSSTPPLRLCHRQRRGGRPRRGG